MQRKNLPKRHRRVCRDREHCTYHRSNSCECIHEEEISDKQAQINLLSQENKELREEIKNKIVQIEQLSKDMANILKRVEAIEKVKFKHLNSTNGNVKEKR